MCKVRAAIARIEEILGSKPDEKLIVFAHHKAVREAIAKAYPNAIVLNTETKDRDAQVNLFQTSTPHWLFITSPRIGGLGITLTAASQVLFVDAFARAGADQFALELRKPSQNRL
jgi:SWI/SNF-related matrix-associated actin-dependent regulator 1 of chromatin subfamily A